MFYFRLATSVLVVTTYFPCIVAVFKRVIGIVVPIMLTIMNNTRVVLELYTVIQIFIPMCILLDVVIYVEWFTLLSILIVVIILIPFTDVTVIYFIMMFIFDSF